MALRAALVRAGLGSRREMAASLGAQKVTLNGVVADVNAKLRAGDVVALNGKVVANIHSLPQHTTVLLHKPLGVVSTCSDPQRRRTVLDLVPREMQQGLHPVGRLDVFSRGAILMTTDGDLTQQLTHPKYGVSRVYHVRIPSAVSVTQLAQWRGGVASAGRPPMRVKVLQSSPSQTVLEVALSEGRNRQIRNTVASLGLSVEDIHRVSYGPVSLSGLRAGHWRVLDHEKLMAKVLQDRRDARDAAVATAAQTSTYSPADKAQEVRQNRMLAANLQKMRPKTALPVWTPKGFKVPAPTKQAL